MPRNHRHRFSLYLSEAKALDLVEAAIHAMRIGCPLNRFVTINFTRADTVARPQDAVGHYLRLVSRFFRERGVRSTFLWVLEQAQGTGLHVHILLHCPDQLAASFAYRARFKWLRLSGVEARRGVSKIITVGPRGYCEGSKPGNNWKSYTKCLSGLLRYLLKSMDPSEPSSLLPRLEGRQHPSGCALLGVRPAFCSAIYGRRCSRSENISAGARNRWHTGAKGPPKPNSTVNLGKP